MKPNVTGYRVLIEPEEIEEKWKTSIPGFVKHEVTIDSDRRNLTIGKVLQVGPDCYKKDFCVGAWCKEGDMVLINVGAGSPYYDRDDNEKLYLIVNEEDIKATLY